MNRKLTAVLLITAAVLTNAAFTVLGTVFNYPDILKEPVDDILAAFRAHQAAVIVWFAVMALSAALFAPIAVGVGRLSTHRAMRVAVPVGIAAAVVQVIGLSRWPLLVPGLRRRRGQHRSGGRRRGPRLVRDGPPHPRQRHRRDLRLPAHRRLDAAGPGRPGPKLRRSLVHRPRRPSPRCSSSPACCPR